MSNPQEAVIAVLAVEEFLASQTTQGVNIKYSVWKYLVMFGTPNLCDQCASYYGDEYELDNPDDLEVMFEFGYFEDEFTFKPMIHPNCRCRIERVRDYDVDNNLIKW